MFWLAVLVFASAAVWVVARIRRTVKERERAEEARAASLLAGLVGSAATPANPVDELTQQKLLLDSARKAGEAGEPALAIQLYARLLARYPSSTFSDQARAGAEAQKKKLIKA